MERLVFHPAFNAQAFGSNWRTSWTSDQSPNRVDSEVPLQEHGQTYDPGLGIDLPISGNIT